MPNVLIVDDDEDTRTLLSEGLKRRGLAVDVAASAQECLEQVRDHDVDVIITDVQMPGLSGVQLCEQLRERHPQQPRTLGVHGRQRQGPRFHLFATGHRAPADR